MPDLMENTTDFSWQGAKAAHAVLCCKLEWVTVTWDQTDHIDRIRRAHAQKHARFVSKSWVKSGDSQKPWFCKLFQNGTCQHVRDHKTGGRLPNYEDQTQNLPV